MVWLVGRAHKMPIPPRDDDGVTVVGEGVLLIGRRPAAPTKDRSTRPCF